MREALSQAAGPWCCLHSIASRRSSVDRGALAACSMARFDARYATSFFVSLSCAVAACSLSHSRARHRLRHRAWRRARSPAPAHRRRATSPSKPRTPTFTLHATTDSDGEFELPQAPIGVYRLRSRPLALPTSANRSPSLPAPTPSAYSARRCGRDADRRRAGLADVALGIRLCNSHHAHHPRRHRRDARRQPHHRARR